MAHDVEDDNGTVIGSIPLSENQLAALENGATISVQFHTPQLLHSLLGQRSGSFEISKNAAGKIRAHADHIPHLRRFIELQKDIKKARES